MRARREIVDPVTHARVSSDAPAAVDTGRVVVGHHTVVPEEDLEPADDRFGIAPQSQAELREQMRQDAARHKAPKTTKAGRVFSTTMTSAAAGVSAFEQENPHFFEAPGFDDVDIHDRARDFLDGIEVCRGKRCTRMNRTAKGRAVLDKSSGGGIVRGVLQLLFERARGRWRDVPWEQVQQFMGEVADALPEGPSAATLRLPIAAGRDKPDVMLARVREELGSGAASAVVRKMNADEVRELAERMENALARVGEECLAPAEERVIKERLRTLRRWARDPSRIPEMACQTSDDGELCTFPAIEEDIARLESSCDRKYDPAWAASKVVQRSPTSRTRIVMGRVVKV